MSSAVQKDLENFLYGLIFFVSQLIYEVLSFSMWYKFVSAIPF